MKVGSVLGHYHVIRTLGQGGMGAVYEASDTRLNRLVALKLLPPKVANNPEWFKRFEREAQAVAALNHPNIVTIHSVEEIDDVHFIILELVGGKTLDEIIPEDGLNLEQFFDIAIPLADALAAAHRRGIAHRDLKPSNIMVDEEGRVKVLDFGIAKLVEDVPEDEAATQVGSEVLTEEGKIVGTVAYMSPEQAEGKAADARSDIFSLGIMLYEMATGIRPFVGDTKLSILASIVKDDPPSVVERNLQMPRHLARIVKKTLEKDLKRRYQSMVELHNDLVELREEVESGEPLATGAFTGETVPFRDDPERGAPAWPKWAALATRIAAVAALVWAMLSGGGGDPSVAPTVATTQLTTTAGLDFGGTISPDGEWFAYARRSNGTTNVYLQSVGSRTPIELTRNGGVSPAFSPDGARIAFSGPPGAGSITEGGGISIMGRTGDDLRRLTEFGFNPAWSPDGSKIVFGTEYVTSRPYQRTDLGDNLHVLDVGSGEITTLEIPDGVQPSWSPNGHRIAYWGSTGGRRDIFTVAADGGDPVPVTEDDAVDFSPVWSPDGAWLYFASTRGGSMAIWRMPIDEETGALRGDAQQITTGGISEPGMLSVSRDGTRILYTATLNRGSIVAADFDPETLTVAPRMVPVVLGSRRLLSPHVSEDGDWIVYFNEGAQQDLFVAHTDGSDERQITDDPAKDWFPRWSPDGQSIAFYSNSTGFYEIWVMNPEGTGRVRLTDSGDQNPIRPIWSHDGARIIFNTDVNSFIVDSTLPFDQQQPEIVPRMPDSDLIIEARDWSSDGTRILGVCRDEQRVPAGICLYWIERGEFEMLAEGNYALPLWMADDRRVLYQLPPAEYRVIDSVTKESWPVVMPESPIPVTSFTLSPDDRRAYLNQVESESDIWMLEIG